MKFYVTMGVRFTSLGFQGLIAYSYPVVVSDLFQIGVNSTDRRQLHFVKKKWYRSSPKLSLVESNHCFPQNIKPTLKYVESLSLHTKHAEAPTSFVRCDQFLGDLCWNMYLRTFERIKCQPHLLCQHNHKWTRWIEDVGNPITTSIPKRSCLVQFGMVA